MFVPNSFICVITMQQVGLSGQPKTVSITEIPVDGYSDSAQIAHLFRQLLLVLDVTVLFNGQNYIQSGTYTQILTASNGCDSVLTLNINIGTSTTQSLSFSGCDSVVLNGQAYYQSGNYSQVLSSGDGCDSVLNISISITNIDTTVTQNGLTIIANQDSAQYQWYDCNNNQMITGAVNQSFTATASGNYYVLINQAGCSASSACTAISISSSKLDSDLGINIYPNPNNGNFNIDLRNNQEVPIFSLFNVAGQEILATYTLNNGQINVRFDAAAGMYYLKSGNSVFKIIKTQ